MKGTLRRAEKELRSRLARGTPSFALQLRVDRYRLAVAMERVFPEAFVSAWLAVRSAEDVLKVVDHKLEHLDTFHVGSLGQELGVRPTTPCDTGVLEQKDRVRVRKERLGPRPPMAFICHRCDVPLCVAADHLFWGSALDNARDCALKGRGRSGRRFGSPAEYAAHHRERLSRVKSKYAAILDRARARLGRVISG